MENLLELKQEEKKITKAIANQPARITKRQTEWDNLQEQLDKILVEEQVEGKSNGRQVRKMRNRQEQLGKEVAEIKRGQTLLGEKKAAIASQINNIKAEQLRARKAKARELADKELPKAQEKGAAGLARWLLYFSIQQGIPLTLVDPGAFTKKIIIDQVIAPHLAKEKRELFKAIGGEI